MENEEPNIIAEVREILDSLYDAVYILDTQRRIVYWNPSAERLTGFPASEVIGHSCADNILMHVDETGQLLCKGRCPMATTMEDGRQRESELFLHHRAGHRVPVLAKTAPIYNGEGELVGAIEIFNDNTRLKEMKSENEALKQLALVDEMTQVANRRYGEARIRETIEEAKRYRWASGILFIDIDDFKGFNDKYGHLVGDQVLRMVAQTLKNGLRSFDLTCRWGGEEFLCVVRNVGFERLGRVGEKLRSLVQCSFLRRDGRELAVTVSIGGTIIRPDDTLSQAVVRADQAMYESKRLGGNRVNASE